MVPSGNVVFIDLQPPRTRRHFKRIRHERDSVEINHNAPNGLTTQCGTENIWTEHRIHTAATLGWLRAGHWVEIFPSYEVKDGDIRRAVATIADLPSSTLPDSPFILALGTPAAQNVPQTGTLAQRALERWVRTLCENKAVAILAQMQAGWPALIQKMAAKCLLPLSLTGHLPDAKALVDDSAAFTREMTKILLEKQSHPLIAQMIKPAGSSDPPPSYSAASSTGSHEHSSAGTPVRFQ